MTLNVVTFVLVLLVNCAICEKCFDLNEDGTCKQTRRNEIAPEISTHTAEPLPKPKALNMMSEDEDGEETLFMQQTLLSTISTAKPSINVTEPIQTTTLALMSPPNAMDEPKGRAINFSLADHSYENVLLNNISTKHEIEDLSDVNMDDEDDFMDKMTTLRTTHNVTFGKSCIKGGLTYEHGEQLESECDSICTCTNGDMDCVDRCLEPFLKKAGAHDDPLCEKKDTDDPCCAILVCASHIDVSREEVCVYKNKTYSKNERIEDGCDLHCTCESQGKVSCKPRCAPTNKTLDRCVEVPDPMDSCCRKVLCDVTLNDYEPEKDQSDTPKLIAAKYLNDSAIKLEFEPNVNKLSTLPEVEISKDKQIWTSYSMKVGGYIQNPKSGSKYVKLKNGNDVIQVQNKSSSEPTKRCEYKGRMLKIGEEYNDNCTSLCVCRENGIQCLNMDCPTYFGVDVLNPNCIKWETEPPNFVPTPPQCCPKAIKCISTGSCMYENVLYENWQQIPTNVTGCEKRCYCEMGKIECQNVCQPVTALPPPTLHCPPHLAVLDHLPDDDCCMYWVCSRDGNSHGINGQIYPGGFVNIPPGFQQSQDEINVQNLEAIDSHTIRLAFTVPPVIVGLHGRVEVRYTSQNNDDPNSWQLQVFAPPNDLIETAQLEFELLGLKEDTEYKIKIIVTLRDLHNTPSSRVYTVRTLKNTPLSTLPPAIPIEPNLSITDINATWVNVAWRKFTDYELQFIDGVQIRYREIDGKIYAATPLIHRAVTTYTLENLKPNSKYEAGIFFIPFSGQMTELHAEHMIHFTTANEHDDYEFNVTLEITHVKATSVEITWAGVPYPEDKYVNIFRAIYQSDSGKGDYSTFKVAKRDAPPKTTIMDLKPGVRYRLWLEIYLTNGRIKTSNVQDFVTKPRTAPSLGASSQQGKLESDEYSETKGDYYGPLVIVAILAAIAILSTLILLLILVKRHSQNKAAITSSPRVSQSAYDNPTYKVEIQQETMDL